MLLYAVTFVRPRSRTRTTISNRRSTRSTRLVFRLKSLTLQSAPLLLAYIRGVDWSAVDYATRLVVLHETNTAITRMREHNGMEPIDDGLPGDRDNVFRTIRHVITSSRPAGAAPEPMPVHEHQHEKKEFADV